MPYKLGKNGKTILVKRGNRWVVKYRHTTKAKALAQLRALKANVKH